MTEEPVVRAAAPNEERRRNRVEKVEQLANAIPYEWLQANAVLANGEPLISVA